RWRAAMPIEAPPRGSVIVYPYLWLRQAQAGETEGRKDRPCCLSLAIEDSRTGEHHLMLLAISSQPPSGDQKAIEIPATERRRAGLTRYPAAWIVTSEFNYDIAERSFYFDPSLPALGRFSAEFLKLVAQAVQTNRARRISRQD
ncbi:MAG: hypothetical protein K0R83_1834, partial [Caulobacter sp.]|nr:hypothetical protein [Caulobacter sp.]